METQKVEGEGLKKTEPTSPWKYGGGRNDKHQSPGRWEVLRNDLAATKTKIANIKAKPYPNCKKDRLKLEATFRHLQRELGIRGEVHSMRPKGGIQ